MMFIDARLPVRFGCMQDRASDEAVLTDSGDEVGPPVARFTPGDAGHPADCACCVLRSEAAVALAALFRERAVGQGRPFRGVLAVVGPAGQVAVRAALAEDAFVSGRYRLG